jgi:hypothetical protein
MHGSGESNGIFRLRLGRVSGSSSFNALMPIVEDSVVFRKIFKTVLANVSMREHFSRIVMPSKAYSAAVVGVDAFE